MQMNATPKSWIRVDAETAAEAQFLAVIVYEDDVTFERAESLYRRLLKDFSHDTNFHCQFVHFHALSLPAIAADAAAQAARADLVVFSCHARQKLSEGVAHWIETWLPQKHLEDSAIAALIGIPGEDAAEVAAIHGYLQTVADRGRRQFFASDAEDEKKPVKATPVLSFPNETKTKRDMKIATENAWQHWGIND